jgi:DNA-binding NarL/FixJ family response regulator
MIRVLLADDHDLVRAGLSALLGSTGEIDVVGEAADGLAALDLARTLRPDVVVSDVRMPRMDGPSLVSALAAEGGSPVILLTTFDDDRSLIESIRAGAKAYLLKAVELDTLLRAIRAVASGADFGFDGGSERLRRAIAEMVQATDDFAPDRLTGRELEVLRLMSNGLTNKEISEALRIGEGTVKNHVSILLSKVGVDDRTKAVLKAFREGLI